METSMHMLAEFMVYTGLFAISYLVVYLVGMHCS